MSSENINEAYGLMDQSLVTSQAEASQLTSRLQTIKNSKDKIDKELQNLQITLAKQAMEEVTLNNRYQLALSVYQDFRKKLDEAKIYVFSKSQDLKILDPAIIPSRPEKPRKMIIVMVTFLTTGLGFVFLAFLLEYFQKKTKPSR
jgi:uncharacterized protein involved in exopolysaccharide biosynthesis